MHPCCCAADLVLQLCQYNISRDNTHPPAFLRDLLYRWLAKGHATLEELCQALREDDEIVGGAGVADNLREKFLRPKRCGK